MNVGGQPGRTTNEGEIESVANKVKEGHALDGMMASEVRILLSGKLIKPSSRRQDMPPPSSSQHIHHLFHLVLLQLRDITPRGCDCVLSQKLHLGNDI